MKKSYSIIIGLIISCLLLSNNICLAEEQIQNTDINSVVVLDLNRVDTASEKIDQELFDQIKLLQNLGEDQTNLQSDIKTIDQRQLRTGLRLKKQLN